MASAFDVASYILKKTGPITAMKLQKLLYYCQAWSLVWDEKPLFRENIEAWINGPVVPAVYRLHKGMFKVNAKTFPDGDPLNLSQVQRETIDGVVNAYNPLSSQQLSDLTHSEPPWRDARRGLSDADRGTSKITNAALSEYYGSLQ